MNAPIKYGSAPGDLGRFGINGSEMLMYVYLPVVIPGVSGNNAALPPRLEPIRNIVDTVWHDGCDLLGVDEMNQRHVYVTMKRMWVDSTSLGNRPGWHADGYGSNGDLNYIWCDMNPTEFAIQQFDNIPDDDIASMTAMAEQVDQDNIKTYPTYHLLRLNESVVHRVSPHAKAGVRTFLKVSVSRHQYNLVGNSHNYLLDYKWDMYDRFGRRNVDNKDFA